MHRLLRSTGMAIGLPVLVAFASSCVDSLSTSPAPGVRSLSQDASAHGGPAVVISQIYGGGSNSGAPLRSDFIELFNPGHEAVNVTGWSVQYAAAGGSSTFNAATPLSGEIPAGGYYLVRQSTGSAGAEIPTPDATGTINLAAGSGKVLLIRQTAALGLGSIVCPSGPLVVDLVSFGSSAYDCGSGRTPTGSNSLAIFRKDGGCAISGSLSADFQTDVPAPRNSASPPNLCSGGEPVVIDHVTLTPASASLEVGSALQLEARAYDASNQQVGAVFTWTTSPSGIVTVSNTGLVTAVGEGDAMVQVASSNGKTATSAIHVDEVALPNLPAVRFSEIHYDNVATDVGEFIEVEGPSGTDLTGWSVVLYNGADSSAYGVRTLNGTIAPACGARGVMVLDYEQDGIQNGGPDGLALIDRDGQLVEFLSYEGAFKALDGPAAGVTSTNIGVIQSSAPHFQTLQRRSSGVWEGPKASTRGGCHGSTPVTPVNQLSFSGRVPFDAPLPVGFEDQIFASLRAPNDARVSTSIAWSSLTPAIASIDQDGVFRALAAGTATFLATALDGTTNTFSLPMVVAEPSTTAQYGNHAEFGEPTDADASDDYVIRRTEFTSSFNRNRGIPNWVAYNLEATHIVSGQDRCDCFTYDPMLPADFPRYTTADYTGAGTVAGYGIDRGHLARSFDRTAGALDNARTFYFSNIIPQAADNNQGPWADFENHLGAMALGGDRELYIVTGASGSKGTVKNEGRITIPSHVWKVAVIMPRNQGAAQADSHDDIQVLAVILPNDAGIRNVPWETYLTTVDAVEALSGYNVLALLPDDIEGLVESGLFRAQLVVDGLAAAGEITRGNATSLTAKLRAAALSLEGGDRDTAANQLRALLNEVSAMERARRLSAADASAIRTVVASVLGT